MESIIVEFPNRDIISISLNEYENDDNYKEYLNNVEDKNIAKELYTIDNILNDTLYWKHNDKIYHKNIFDIPHRYTKKGLISYKNMLLNTKYMVD